MPPSPGVDVPAYIIAAVLGIVLCLWGIQLSRFIASLTTAAVLGYLTYTYTYVALGSTALAIIFMLIAIGVGLALGFTLFRLGLSIVFGYMIASIITKSVIGFRGAALVLILTVVFAALIYVLSRHILVLLFVTTGSALLYKSLVVLELSPRLSLAVVVLVAAVGVYNQLKRKV
jgi:hypothetical protein